MPLGVFFKFVPQDPRCGFCVGVRFTSGSVESPAAGDDTERILRMGPVAK